MSIAVLLIAFSVGATAQTVGADVATDLRARFGPPLHRETFLIPAGEMVVDYAATGDVCRIHLPAFAPEEDRPGVSSAKAMDEFLLKLVPLNVRGKELGRMAAATGAPAISTVEYENVAISEMLQGGTRTGMTVTFKLETCADPVTR